jgi:type II secretion system protein J
MRTFRRSIRGFTLAEVLLASSITLLITVVAVSALKAVSDTSRTVERQTQETSPIRYAAHMIARDLANFYRDPDSQSMLLTGTSQNADSTEPPSLRFYAAGRVKARVGRPEGDVYEVEYALGAGRATKGKVDAETSRRTLYRRWCPNPDPKRKEPGGILAAIAENIDVLQIRFHDGKQWQDQWTPDSRELPQLIEVTLASVPQGRGQPTVESFTVCFPRTSRGGQSGGPESGSPEQQGEQQGQPPSQGGPGGGQPESGGPNPGGQ